MAVVTQGCSDELMHIVGRPGSKLAYVGELWRRRDYRVVMTLVGRGPVVNHPVAPLPILKGSTKTTSGLSAQRADTLAGHETRQLRISIPLLWSKGKIPHGLTS